MSTYQPTLHKPIPMGTRVRVPAGFCSVDPVLGRVAGISMIHVVFGYIVILDTPIETEYGIQEAVSVTGSALESEDGKANWRIS